MNRGEQYRDDVELTSWKAKRERAQQWKPRALEEALAAITGSRNDDYGDPWDNHANTAEAWEWWLRCRFGIDVTITALDVCMFNILQKSARLSHSPQHWDSWVDVAGFAGNAGACLDYGERDGAEAKDQ